MTSFNTSFRLLLQVSKANSGYKYRRLSELKNAHQNILRSLTHIRISQKIRKASSALYLSLSLRSHHTIKMKLLAFKETVLIKRIQNLKDELELVRVEMVMEFKYPSASQQKEILSPYAEMHKDKNSPVQTVTGKDTSNPLIPVCLEKTEAEVQTSLTLAKPSDYYLRTSGGIQIPDKSEGQTLVLLPGNKKAYYVVFTGPHSGIYTTWNMAEKAIKGFSDVKRRKYKTFEEASTTARIYTTSQFKAPLSYLQKLVIFERLSLRY